MATAKSGARIAVGLVLLCLPAMTSRAAFCGEKAGAPAAAPAASGGGLAVLSGDSNLRIFQCFRTPVAVGKDGQTKTPADLRSKEGKPIAEFASPLPPADWMKPEFDDSAWDREKAPVETGPGGATGNSHAARHTATASSLICARSKFFVEDPARVNDLKLDLEFVGGAVVYLNGQEVTRASLPAGELKPETLAEKYPDDLYCEDGGMFLQDIRKNQAGFDRRYRKISGLALPSKLLKKGANVLAVELHRAPVNEAAIEAKRVALPGGMSVIPGIWSYVSLKDLALTAGAGSAVTPNTERPKGVQVWNCAPFDTIISHDFGDGGDLLPVTVSSPRNGVFSGRLVVSSDAAIKGLKVSVSELTAAEGGGKIPASAVRVRYAAAVEPGKSWAPAFRYDALFEAIPAEIPVSKAPAPKEFYPRNHGKYVGSGPIQVMRRNQTPGALAPLWFTVRVPKDAKAGRYEGRITLSADGLKATEVPLKLTVSEWAMPDPKDFRLMHFAYHSEDAIAKHYGVPLWSDKHLELLGRSMGLMAEVNSRQAIVNLAINFYGGDKGGVDCSNEESMVRWVKQADGSWKHDYSVLDKYLETVAKHVGKPTLLRINCWGEAGQKDGKLTHKGLVTAVSSLDPATGKLGRVDLPVPGTEESFNFWKPVLDEVRKKAEARGWWDVTAQGWNSYCYPPIPEVVSMHKKLWPDGQWSYTAHNGTLGMRFNAVEKGVYMPTRQADSVWTLGPLKPRNGKELLKPRPNIWCFTWRTMMRDYSDLTLLRSVPEDEILRAQDGVSDFGADIFPVKDERGRFREVGNGRGTGGPGCSTLAMLAPGPDGPVATERFEMLREGTEICEAILFLEKALLDGKASGDLAAKINRCLDERGEVYINSWPSGRFERDLKTLELAGQAASGK